MSLDYNLDKVLVVMPARGGSKRIPHKNIIQIYNKPMILWPLNELMQIFRPEQIIVSTDSSEIQKLVKSAGLNIPFTRPSELADDHASTMAVVNHAYEWALQQGLKYDFVLTVYPTAVTLQRQNIVKALEVLLGDSQCECAFSAAEFPSPAQRAFSVDQQGYLFMRSPEYLYFRTQDLDATYHDAGQFYLFRSGAVAVSKTLNQMKNKMIIIPRKYVVDIDTHEDLEYAELKLRILREEHERKNG